MDSALLCSVPRFRNLVHICSDGAKQWTASNSTPLAEVLHRVVLQHLSAHYHCHVALLKHGNLESHQVENLGSLPSAAALSGASDLAVAPMNGDAEHRCRCARNISQFSQKLVEKFISSAETL